MVLLLPYLRNLCLSKDFLLLVSWNWLTSPLCLKNRGTGPPPVLLTPGTGCLGKQKRLPCGIFWLCVLTLNLLVLLGKHVLGDMINIFRWFLRLFPQKASEAGPLGPSVIRKTRKQLCACLRGTRVGEGAITSSVKDLNHYSKSLTQHGVY